MQGGGRLEGSGDVKVGGGTYDRPRSKQVLRLDKRREEDGLVE
jgi:hypothetical protein